MFQHDDEQQDKDMIADVLQKIVDEMKGLESDRIMPSDHPSKIKQMEISVEKPTDGETPEEESSELDPKVLSELLDKANSADESGATPDETDMDGIDPEIAKLIAEKKKLKV